MSIDLSESLLETTSVALKAKEIEARMLQTELDKLRALLDTPWPARFGHAPSVDDDEQVYIQAAYYDLPDALALGAALIRAAVKDSQ